MKNLAFAIDEIFKLILIFFISLVFFRATSLTFTLCIILSSLVTFIICILLYFFKTKRLSKKQLKLSQIKAIENLIDQFSYASKTEIDNYFIKLFGAKKNYKKELIIDDNKIIILYNFNKENLEVNDIKTYYKENKNRHINKIIIICNNYSNNCINLIQNFKAIQYEIINMADLYIRFIEPNKNYPNFKIEKLPKEKLNFVKFKEYAFKKNKAKTYFFCGIILMFSSYFVPLKIYYLIFSGLMFVSALLCLILNNKKINY